MLRRRGKPYSQDLRERVFAPYEDGEADGRIAAALRVSVSYVKKVLLRRRLTRQRTARPQRCHGAPKLSRLHSAILERVNNPPDATIAELRARLLARHQVSPSTGLMNKTLAALGLTFKKSPSARPSMRVRRNAAIAWSLPFRTAIGRGQPLSARCAETA